MKKNKKTLIGLSILTVTIVVVGGPFFFNKLKFTAYSHETKNIARSIEGIKRISENNYCQRNDLKYSSGSLGCSVEQYVTANKKSENLSRIETALKAAGWVKRGSNFSLWSQVDNSYKSATLYKNDGADCYIRIQEEQLNEQYFTIGCYASAKAEWFPVRDN